MGKAEGPESLLGKLVVQFGISLQCLRHKMAILTTAMDITASRRDYPYLVVSTYIYLESSGNRIIIEYKEKRNMKHSSITLQEEKGHARWTHREGQPCFLLHQGGPVQLHLEVSA